MRGTTTDELGKEYGRLVVKSRAENGTHGEARWNCECSCGASTTVKGFKLRQGLVQSCGCLKSEGIRRLNARRWSGERKEARTCQKCGEFKQPNEFKSSYGVHCRACLNKYRSIWKKANPLKPEANRARTLRSRYGMTLQDYDKMLSEQNNKCAICEQEFTGKTCIDHVHNADGTDGPVRAILCNNCNGGIGYLKDSRELVAKALDYLTKYATSVVS